MEYIRVVRLEDPLFAQMYQLLKNVFPPEEVLAFDLWKAPLEDPEIRVFVAVHEDEVVGTTEYRYYREWNIAMTDFTIIGRAGLGIGRFLAQQRQKDLQALAEVNGTTLFGMFAEIYDPYKADHHEFGMIKPMDPYVRREVLSHQGYKRLDFEYVHPSWNNDGEAISGLDLCFMPTDDRLQQLPAQLVVNFLKTYYSVLSNKPKLWLEMIEQLELTDAIPLKPL